MLSEQEVKHIAKLARLELSDNDLEKYRKDLSAILDYFKKLEALDVSTEKVAGSFLGRENVTREDEYNGNMKNKREKLLGAVPETKDGYLKVKSIL